MCPHGKVNNPCSQALRWMLSVLEMEASRSIYHALIFRLLNFLFCSKGGGGKGGGRGGSGGNEGESESFNFRQWLAKFGQGLGKTGRSLGKTAAAILLLLSIFYASHFIQPLSRATVNGLRWVLRLDGAGSRRVSHAKLYSIWPCHATQSDVLSFLRLLQPYPLLNSEIQEQIAGSAVTSLAQASNRSNTGSVPVVVR